jgi:multidrug efflux system outer membrane protein
MSRRRTIGACLALGALSACTLGPDYKKPDIATPAAFTEAASTARVAVSPDDADLSQWWTQFDDPLLTWLIDRGLNDNPDLAAAASRVREARQQEIIAGAAEYPTINATGNAVTFNSNRNAEGGGAPPQGLTLPGHANLYAAGFDATWEVDLFGGTRRAREAAKDTTQAQAWAERDGEVSLSAEIANDYLTLRALQARIALGEAELQRQKGVFDLIGARRRTGFVTNLDVNQQSSVVATAAAQIPQLDAQARGQIHALGVLVGETPEALAAHLGLPGALPPPPPTLPTGLPSELLRRRPDVREAERRLAASNAQVGEQIANLYPKLELIGLASFATNSIGNLFSADNFASAAVGMATQPLFDGGRRHASVRVAQEETKQAALAYRGAVLVALRDVEDALARYKAEETRRSALARSVTAAQGSLTIAQDQYRTGFVTFINVYQAQITLFNAQDQLTQSDGQIVTDLVAIYKALGGGWAETKAEKGG